MKIMTATDGSDGLDASAGPQGFAAARACFATIEGWLAGQDSSGLEHAELEQQLDTRGRELLRLLFQDHVDLRALREGRLEVAGACQVICVSGCCPVSRGRGGSGRGRRSRVGRGLVSSSW